MVFRIEWLIKPLIRAFLSYAYGELSYLWKNVVYVGMELCLALTLICTPTSSLRWNWWDFDLILVWRDLPYLLFNVLNGMLWTWFCPFLIGLSLSLIMELGKLSFTIHLTTRLTLSPLVDVCRGQFPSPMGSSIKKIKSHHRSFLGCYRSPKIMFLN